MAADRGAIPVNGADIAWMTEGAGPDVVLIHSAIADMRMWDPLVARLRKRRYRVIRYDMRGWGESPRPPGRYSHIEDLAALLTELGDGPATLVGCSLGSRVAVEFALEHPDAARALLLLSPFLRGHKWTPELGQFWAERRQDLDNGDIDAAVRLNVDQWASGLPEEQQQLIADMQRRAFELEVAVDAQQDDFEPPAAQRLGELRLPTLIAVGEHDFSDFHAVADRLARGIAHSRTAMIPGGGHLFPMERPRETAGLLEELERVPPGLTHTGRRE
jgi:pimeloyl-ACP methyl ester carboxylesterase